MTFAVITDRDRFTIDRVRWPFTRVLAGLAGCAAHEPGDARTFEVTFELPADATRFVWVQPFTAPVAVAVPLGTARVWRGGIGSVAFTP